MDAIRSDSMIRPYGRIYGRNLVCVTAADLSGLEVLCFTIRTTHLNPREAVIRQGIQALTNPNPAKPQVEISDEPYSDPMTGFMVPH